MLLWSNLITLLIGLMLIIGGIKVESYYWRDEIKRKNKIIKSIYRYRGAILTIGWVMTVIAGIIVAVMVMEMGVRHIRADIETAQLYERYNAIVYKIEGDSCRDEFGLLNKEIIDEVQDWNENIVYYQGMKDNFWVGIVYPDIYDQFHTIDYTEFDKK